MSGYIGKSQGVTQVDGYNRSEADAEFVQTAGDTMTGSLTIPSMTSTGAITASGGVYLGGTSAVNLLDDYEEGTWEPYWSDLNGNAIFTSAPSDKYGYYTKIGDTVTANCYFVMPTSFSVTGFYVAAATVCVGGLPFTPKADASLMNYYAGCTGYYQGFAGYGAGYTPMPYVNIGTPTMPIVYANGAAAAGVGHAATYSALSGIMISVTYKTAS